MKKGYRRAWEKRKGSKSRRQERIDREVRAPSFAPIVDEIKALGWEDVKGGKVSSWTGAVYEASALCPIFGVRVESVCEISVPLFRDSVKLLIASSDWRARPEGEAGGAALRDTLWPAFKNTFAPEEVALDGLGDFLADCCEGVLRPTDGPLPVLFRRFPAPIREMFLVSAEICNADLKDKSLHERLKELLVDLGDVWLEEPRIPEEERRWKARDLVFAAISNDLEAARGAALDLLLCRYRDCMDDPVVAQYIDGHLPNIRWHLADLQRKEEEKKQEQDRTEQGAEGAEKYGHSNLEKMVGTLLRSVELDLFEARET